jgi:very-short-patch-repair endonuclease
MVQEKGVAELARRQHGLVERSQVLRLGISDKTISRWVGTGRWERLHPGVYRIGGAPPAREQTMLAACLAAGEAAVLSHRAAASLWDVWPQDAAPELSVPGERQPRITGAVVHRSLDLRPDELTVRKSIPVTKPARTLLDLGAVAPDWVVSDVLERAIVTRLLTPVAADRIVEEHGRRGRSGVGVLRRVLDRRALGSGIPDGLLEPRMASLLRRFDLPPAAFQRELRDGQGRFLARPDFCWPELWLIVEVDGHETHGTPQAMADDFVRQNALMAAGWTVLRFTWDQVVRRPKYVADVLRPFFVRSLSAQGQLRTKN